MDAYHRTFEATPSEIQVGEIHRHATRFSVPRAESAEAFASNPPGTRTR